MWQLYLKLQSCYDERDERKWLLKQCSPLNQAQLRIWQEDHSSSQTEQIIEMVTYPW